MRWDVSCDLNDSRYRAEMMPLGTLIDSLGLGTAKEASYTNFESVVEHLVKSGLRHRVPRRT